MAEYNGAFSDVSAIELGAHAAARGAGAHGHRPGRDRPRHLRQRPADLRRRHLRRAARRPEGGRPEGSPGPHGQPPLRLRLRVDRPGGAPDPPRRGEDRPRGRHGEHVAGPARDPRRAQGPAPRAGALEDSLMVALLDTQCGLYMAQTSDRVAAKYGVTREEQDEYALSSQQRAAAAWGACRLSEEVAPIEVKAGRKTVRVEKDDHLRPDTTLEGLAALPPSFGKGGQVTAGNASGIVDGAAAVVVTSADEARARGKKPLGRLIGWAVTGVEPELMGIGPAPAARAALAKAGLRQDRHRPLGDQRGLRRPDPRRHPRARPRPREAERQRRRDRARPSARRDGHPLHADTPEGDAPARRSVRPRGRVHRRRPGHRGRARIGLVRRGAGLDGTRSRISGPHGGGGLVPEGAQGEARRRLERRARHVERRQPLPP